MSAMNHRREGDDCFWCGNTWPCPIAEIRHQLADHIRKTAADSDGPASQWNWWDAATIPDQVADLIDIFDPEGN